MNEEADISSYLFFISIQKASMSLFFGIAHMHIKTVKKQQSGLYYQVLAVTETQICTIQMAAYIPDCAYLQQCFLRINCFIITHTQIFLSEY